MTRVLKHTKEQYIESGVAEWLAAYPESNDATLRAAMLQMWDSVMQPMIDSGALVLPAINDWIEWHGGKCPVDDATEVEVEYDGTLDRGQAYTFAWYHDGSGDITAYRVLPCAN